MSRAKGLNTAGTKTQMRFQLAMTEARTFASFTRNYHYTVNIDESEEDDEMDDIEE